MCSPSIGSDVTCADEGAACAKRDTVDFLYTPCDCDCDCDLLDVWAVIVATGGEGGGREAFSCRYSSNTLI